MGLAKRLRILFYSRGTRVSPLPACFICSLILSFSFFLRQRNRRFTFIINNTFFLITFTTIVISPYNFGEFHGVSINTFGVLNLHLFVREFIIFIIINIFFLLFTTCSFFDSFFFVIFILILRLFL